MTGDRTPERRVRDALHDAVDHVEPSPGLTTIRARLQEDAMPSSRPRSRTALLALGGAAAVAVVVTGVAVLAQDDGRPSSDGQPVGQTSVSPTTSAPSPSSPASSPLASPPSGSTVTVGARAVPVYYVGTTPTGPRLFREFHQKSASDDDAVLVALQEAVHADPFDPDYRTGWPEGTNVDDVTLPGSEDVVTIDLSGAAVGSLHDRPNGMSRAEAQMAVQQLIYTAQAGLQDRVPVRFTLDGRLTDQVLGVPASEPLANDDEMSTTGTVWITSPQDGDTVKAGDVVVTGRGAFFEATAAWQLLQDGKVVASGAGMSKECCTLSPYEITIPEVEPGDYVVRVYDEDMSGGEGPGEAEDTKQITVR
jgi:hypothetical protein